MLASNAAGVECRIVESKWARTLLLLLPGAEDRGSGAGDTLEGRGDGGATTTSTPVICCIPFAAEEVAAAEEPRSDLTMIRPLWGLRIRQVQATLNQTG